MALKIEDYALIGDCETAALVGIDGSIDWLCWPDFSSPACFAALIGTKRNGRWYVAPKQSCKSVTRQYRDHTLILETRFETASGVLLLIDFMPVRETHSDIVRIVKCLEGTVTVQIELCVRFDYGRTTPWTGTRERNGWAAAAGTGVVYLRTQQPMQTKNDIASAEFVLTKEQQRVFVLTYTDAQETPPRRINANLALRETEQFWLKWCASSNYDGISRGVVERSLITLKALTYRPSGGIVAAPTTSLPERMGADRNWDYRYCWLRDAAFTLESLLSTGYRDEARAWQEWLLQAVGSDVRSMQIMYGMHGERHLPECELPWLHGYRKSQPVRFGNAASEQLQLDVYGEVADAIVKMKCAGIHSDQRVSHLLCSLTDYVASICHLPASGLWEQRNRVKHYTYSKAMAWLALNHGIEHVQAGNTARWKAIRDRLYRQICRRGFNRKLGSFVQSFDSDVLDASVLLLPFAGFLPFSDERVRSTIDTVLRKLTKNGFVYRFAPRDQKQSESSFVACSFWMVQSLAGIGRRSAAERLFQKLISRCNDVGLIAEEYDPDNRRFMGNFPQALSHIALINAARALSSQ
ncbi:glycoside hydrolase family 15 protein [Edaphobacter acidisoli]|uniref:glycoside hydrolase family 15 protein n=1 Tax=Edaphobacter acidisoli TaxID=2040573 RepID=UPI001664B9BF|nr:glycoside hydrolase family 15 protein [Edaphobacter acidisoli]